MTRIFISDNGTDKNDGLSKDTPVYSWRKARKVSSGHLEINVDSSAARKRLMKEIERLTKPKSRRAA
jgi:hypothetical protein